MRRRERMARAIVRLYPRAWRVRYEDEMLALIQQTTLDARRILDLAMSLASEWVRYAGRQLDAKLHRPSFSLLVSLVVALMLSTLSFVVASWLSQHIVTPPITWMEDGHRVVLPPRLPSLLSFLGPLVLALVFWRFIPKFLPKSRPRKIRPAGVRESCIWFSALLLACVGMQWSMLVGNLGTGLGPASMWQVLGVPFSLTQMGVQYRVSP
jgi:hypothetical protein